MAVKSVAWSPDGSRLAAGVGGTIKIWAVETGDELSSLDVANRAVESISWSANGRELASVAFSTVK